MQQKPTALTSVTFLLGGMALGALAMFMLDPVQGNRRRALAKDQIYSAQIKARKSANALSRDVANRAKGVRARTNRLISKSRPADTRVNP